MNPEKIRELSRTPRVLSRQIEEIQAKPFFFLRKAVRQWEKDMSEGPLVFSAVVQAHECLYDKETAEWAKGVILWTLVPERCQDKTWLADLAEKLSACAEAPSTPDEIHVAGLLGDEDSSIDGRLPASLTGGVEVFWESRYLDPDDLPGGCVPSDRIVVGLQTSDGLALVPSELYM